MACPWRPIEATALYVRQNADGSRLTALEVNHAEYRWVVIYRRDGVALRARGDCRDVLATQLMERAESIR